MSRSLVRHENRTSKAHLILIAKHSIGFRRGVPILRVRKILLAPTLHDGHVTVRHHVLGTGLSLHFGATGIVVPVRVANQ